MKSVAAHVTSFDYTSFHAYSTRVEVDGASWTLGIRYSKFLAFYTALAAKERAFRFDFPPKGGFFFTPSPEDRQVKLDAFLQAVVVYYEEKERPEAVGEMLAAFLQVPEHLKAQGADDDEAHTTSDESEPAEEPKPVEELVQDKKPKPAPSANAVAGKKAFVKAAFEAAVVSALQDNVHKEEVKETPVEEKAPVVAIQVEEEAKEAPTEVEAKVEEKNVEAEVEEKTVEVKVEEVDVAPIATPAVAAAAPVVTTVETAVKPNVTLVTATKIVRTVTRRVVRTMSTPEETVVEPEETVVEEEKEVVELETAEVKPEEKIEVKEEEETVVEEEKEVVVKEEAKMEVVIPAPEVKEEEEAVVKEETTVEVATPAPAPTSVEKPKKKKKRSAKKTAAPTSSSDGFDSPDGVDDVARMSKKKLSEQQKKARNQRRKEKRKKNQAKVHSKDAAVSSS
ncbi:hypothetical protein BBJ28_00018661 [Nothophytophthora sp. Chile5]|nr:hypothetical protein BBJ28_00018661 [Nothophytophthora sp. Chile5]